MERLNVAVIFGGVSSEHEVSCMSACNVLNILDRNKYNVFPVGVTKDGRWLLTSASAERIRTGNWQDDCRPAVISPDRETHGILFANGESARIDVAFPILHGKNGEDGAMAALLQLAGIPQVTTTMTSAACSMDKAITKALCDRAGVPMADWEVLYSADIRSDVSSCVARVEKRFSYPVFVKPASAGSSVGVSKCGDRASLEAGLSLAAGEDFKVLVEECIVGLEIEVAVIGNSSPAASVCGQIAPSQEFYSYDSKYNDASSALYIPAHIDEPTAARVRELAITVYKTMECMGMARVDFFAANDGRVLFNEINTIPGFTDISMYPKLMAHTYYGGAGLADKLIELALAEDRV